MIEIKEKNSTERAEMLIAINGVSNGLHILEHNLIDVGSLSLCELVIERIEAIQEKLLDNLVSKEGER